MHGNYMMGLVLGGELARYSSYWDAFYAPVPTINYLPYAMAIASE